VLTEQVSAVLFDLDGVLVDSTEIVERTWRWWALEHGLAVDDVLAVAHGRPGREVIRLVAPHLDIAHETKRVASHEAADSEGIVAIPGARECVALAARGPWAVVTSAGRELALTRLEEVGLPAPVVLVSADDVASGKPDPEPYETACRVLGLRAAACVAVEDAPAGIEAAKGAGVIVLAVTTTHPAEALERADLVCSDMYEVRRCMSEMVEPSGRRH
jgi:sugar-phosphatase